MNTSVIFDRSMIAPCGINCGTCLAYLRAKNKCCGCLPASTNKPKTRLLCKIKNCEHLEKTISNFCFDCATFPCQRLKQLDKRYRTNYKTSLIQNLKTIERIGILEYLLNETKRWTCPDCGSTISVHRDSCLICNRDLNKNAL
jgi:hypothetical protein